MQGTFIVIHIYVNTMNTIKTVYAVLHKQALNIYNRWLESNFVADFSLSLGAHIAFLLTTVKFIAPLKLTLKRGPYINFGSGLGDSRYGEKPPADITIYLDWTEGEVWACVLHVSTLRTAPSLTQTSHIWRTSSNLFPEVDRHTAASEIRSRALQKTTHWSGYRFMNSAVCSGRRRIFEVRSEEATRGWTQLHKGKVHNICSS
jgi:hypothetical protein